MYKTYYLYYLKHISAILTSATILCFWTFYNGYPLTFNSDSAMYLEYAFYKYVGPDRPIMYGLFMYLTSLTHSLWLVVFTQALIVAAAFYYWFKYFTSVKNFLPFYLGFIAIITFFTGASFNASWLMPDVFTSISILSVGLFIFVKKIKLRDLIIISLLVILSLSMHNTHLYICLCVVLLLSVILVFKKIRKQIIDAGLYIKRIPYIFALILFSYLLSSLIHFTYGGGFKASRGGTVFLFANMVEMGIMDPYLAENCEQQQFNICPYKDTIPNNFLWADNSPMRKTGGWEVSEQEYTAIVKDILTTPKYCKTFIFKSVIYTIKQFFYFNTGEAGIHTIRVTNAINVLYPQEYYQFSKAKQYRGELRFNFVNYAQTLVFAVIILLFIFGFLSKRITIRYKILILFLLTALLLNAWICATFSGVYFRYQGRLIWVLPLPLFLYAMEKMVCTTNLTFVNKGTTKGI
jgi:hypothetical protein